MYCQLFVSKMTTQTQLFLCITLVLITKYSSAFYYCEPDCDGPNEIYTCGSACQTECATLGKPCPFVNVRCNDGCYCEDGYARDVFGKCIPIEECPKAGQIHNRRPDKKKAPIKCTYPNEEYACGSPCQTECASLDEPCPYVNKKCNDGCYCKKGFARNFFGKCVPIAECPKLIGGNTFIQIPQEEYKCSAE